MDQPTDTRPRCDRCQLREPAADARFCGRCQWLLDDAWAFGYSQTHGVTVLEAHAILAAERP